SAYIQYADAPPPCDAPHLTPRADPPGITGQPLAQLVLGDLNGILDPSARKVHGDLKALALNCHWK
ncbi:hypothetical protein ACWCQ6_36685, partial [Streptomyces sp. NPDC001880]